VETTLNSQWQEIAEKIIQKQVSRYGKWQKFQQGALVTINPYNGAIKVMVGGTDFENNQYNRVTQAQRQPGSTFKTFVYATAIASGITPYQTYLDAPYIVDGYQPKNYGDKYRGNYIPLHQALTSSVNVVAVKTLINVGWNPVIQVAKKMGIESELKPTYSLALGASEVNLLELTSAYGTLANQGIHQQSYGINRIVDAQGNVLYQPKFPSQKAIEPDAVNIITWMLQKVVNNGTGIPAQIGRPVAGKTGTSDQARDLWFIGYIPQLVTGVWLGNDDNQPTYGTSATAAAVWRSFMLEAVKDIPLAKFTAPPRNLSVKEATIKAEPIKPKKSYHQEVIQASIPSSRTRRTNYANKRRSYSRARKAKTTTKTTPVAQTNAPIIEKAPKTPPTTPPQAPLLNKPTKEKE
jgi:penicillin-binding protein 1A